MPEDDAIPAPEVPAPASFERSFILDKELLQREQKDDVPAALTTGAYVGVTILTVGLIAILVWGLARIRTRLGADEPPPSGTVGAPSPRSAAPTAA
jgi:hypothetical protein